MNKINANDTEGKSECSGEDKLKKLLQLKKFVIKN